MKKILCGLVLSFVAVAASFVHADANYPYQNPVYIPSAVSPVINYTAPADYVITLQDRGVVAFEINGTCTSLAAVAQVTVDGTTWRSINVYPVVTSTITAAASISAAGAYRISSSGAKSARLHITALTATCNVSAVATSIGTVDK